MESHGFSLCVLGGGQCKISILSPILLFLSILPFLTCDPTLETTNQSSHLGPMVKPKSRSMSIWMQQSRTIRRSGYHSLIVVDCNPSGRLLVVLVQVLLTAKTHVSSTRCYNAWRILLHLPNIFWQQNIRTSVCRNMSGWCSRGYWLFFTQARCPDFVPCVPWKSMFNVCLKDQRVKVPFYQNTLLPIYKVGIWIASVDLFYWSIYTLALSKTLKLRRQEDAHEFLMFVFTAFQKSLLQGLG